MASKAGLPSSLNSSSSENSKPESEVTVKQERTDHDTAPSKKTPSSSTIRAPITSHTSTSNAASNPPAAEIKAKQVAPVDKGPPPLDFASIRGIFGWMTVAGINLPFIIRGEQRYIAVRMVECKIISKYSDILPWTVFTCTNIKSYYITENEAKLLNEINGYHCDHQFGYSHFGTKDVVVSVEDAVRFQRFLAVCKAKLVSSKDNSPLTQACGLLKIHGAIIPYLTKTAAKVVPISLLKEGVTPVKSFLSGMSEWDLAYIKVLCYVAGIDAQNKVVVGSTMCIVDDLRYSHSGLTVHYEEWWPSTFPQYLVGTNQQMSSGGMKMQSFVQESHGKQVVNNLNGFSRGSTMSEMTRVAYPITSRPEDYQPSVVRNPCGCVGNCPHMLDRRGSSLLGNSMANGALRAVPASGYWDQSHQSLPLHATNGGIPPVSRLNSHLTYGEQHLLQSYQEKSSQESPLMAKSYPPPPPLVRLGKTVDESQSLTSPTGERAFHTGNNTQSNLRPPPPLQPAPTISIGKTTVYRDSTRSDMPVIVGVHSLASERNPSVEATSTDSSGRSNKEQAHLSPKQQGSIIAPHHYPTPPQSSPLQSSTPVPVSLTDSTFQPPFIMNPCDYVDLCSPPASPETRHSNGLHETAAIANRLPPLLPFVDIEGHLLPTVNLDPTNPNSTLLTSISAVVSKLFATVPEQSCQFVLENVLGVKLYSNSRYQSISTRDKMIAVSDLKSYLPHLRYMFQKVELSADILKSRSLGEEPRARQYGESYVIFTPNFKPRSLQNSPWSSPRILSPIDGIPNSMSRSAENISFATPPGSPHIRRKSSILRTVLNDGHLVVDGCDDAVYCQPVSGREPEELLRKRLDSLYSKARPMTPHEAKSITALLSSEDEDLLIQTLTTISNCAAFTVNQDYLCDAGCLPLLKEFLDFPSVAVQVAATQAIANLSANEHNQGLLQTCIERLVERSTSRQCGELLRIASLTALANLALFNANHMAMKGGISGFLLLLDEGSSAVRLQSLKLLVNLSCNPLMLPSLLASKASVQLYKYLSLKGEHAITLRLITFLANVMSEASKQKFKARDLPGEQKAPYPETLYAALYGHNGKDLLRKKLASLSSSKDEDIIAQIRRLREALHSSI